MSRYLVFACPRCGTFRYAKEGQKTARCFTCDYQTSLDSHKTRIFLKTESRKQAIEAVKRYKMEIGSSGRL